jgi:hypothetical protein
MNDQITVELERDTPLETVGVFSYGASTGVLANTIVRQRFSCGKGCGFVVNVN